jgi:histidinol phosphatase-like PHP family hydrolase
MAKPRKTLDNAALAELLSQAAEDATSITRRAMKRAARAALSWPVEASELAEGGGSLTELQGVGPFLEKTILQWLRAPPPLSRPDPKRRGFLTRTRVDAILRRHPAFAARLRGDLQMHTQWSDGSGTVMDMAQAAVERGYEYIADTDHAKGLPIAGGIDERELQVQGREILAVNERLRKSGQRLRVLRSVELNLNPAGHGDLVPDCLSGLDIVLGAFHSALQRTTDQTDRYIAALKNPSLHILGHPRGRIFNFRLGLQADWRRVFDTAAKLDKAVEIDSYPDRQDLDVNLLKLAAESGVSVSIGTDAHHPWQLEFIQFGLAAALLAGIPEKRILNFLPAEKLLLWVASHRR